MAHGRYIIDYIDSDIIYIYYIYIICIYIYIYKLGSAFDVSTASFDPDQPTKPTSTKD